LRSFYVPKNWVCIFLAKGFWHKGAHKMSVKLTPSGSIGPSYFLQLLFNEKSEKLLITQQPLKLQKISTYSEFLEVFKK
jgi:hypothetical protein